MAHLCIYAEHHRHKHSTPTGYEPRAIVISSSINSIGTSRDDKAAREDRSGRKTWNWKDCRKLNIDKFNIMGEPSATQLIQHTPNFDCTEFIEWRRDARALVDIMHPAIPRILNVQTRPTREHRRLRGLDRARARASTRSRIAPGAGGQQGSDVGEGRNHPSAVGGGAPRNERRLFRQNLRTAGTSKSGM